MSEPDEQQSGGVLDYYTGDGRIQTNIRRPNIDGKKKQEDE